MQTNEWHVNLMTESGKGERNVRHGSSHPTKREAVRAAMQYRRKDRHSAILRQGRTYTVQVDH